MHQTLLQRINLLAFAGVTSVLLGLLAFVIEPYVGEPEKMGIVYAFGFWWSVAAVGVTLVVGGGLALLPSIVRRALLQRT